jgi:hypothetical protein
LRTWLAGVEIGRDADMDADADVDVDIDGGMYL